MLTSEREPTGDVGSSAVDLAPDAGSLLPGVDAPGYATWGQRVVAAILDNATLAGATWLALGPGYLRPTLTPGLGPPVDQGWAGDPLLLVPVAVLLVLLVLQAVTGWMPGKLVVGIRVVGARSSAPAGLWTTLMRWVLHLLDAILLIGYLRPLWHAERQTFADGIARTVVVQQIPDLPRKHGVVMYSAALVTVALGLGYCFPINSGGSSSLDGFVACRAGGQGPAMTTGEITLGGSVWESRERRMWTVRTSRTPHPGATISWASDPSVRDTRYTVEIEARRVAESGGSEGGGPVVSRLWDVSTGDASDPPTDPSSTHTRNVAPDGDVHVVQVEMQDPDVGDLDDLGLQVWVDARLIADGDTVAECGGSLDYDDVDRTG